MQPVGLFQMRLFMDIDQFFAQSEGLWFSQRSCYHLATQQHDNGKADLTVACLPVAEPRVAQLGDRAQVPRATLWGGVEMSWDTSKQDWNRPKQGGSTLLVLAPQDERRGQLLRQEGSTVVTGDYQVNADDSLTLRATLAGDRQLEERLWFASDNLRLRISTLRQGSTFEQVAFYSEIRRLPPKA